ncbi:ARM repeat-containing protein [Piromyces finnis]|uniref:ARM repeat-containing protein n=1 Tax=Piromyces finnis TaxID=1754191 RepID=A0A1Y1V1U7_9FUNG|nr:ARM repeat-containing protein [Piromyces finnis]|eukprot:ORX45351.1 ARM repeat-containing protein [Piromyces finnis]
MENIKNANLKSDDLLLHLEKYLIYLLPLNYLNHPFLCTNTDGSITKFDCENNKFLEIEDKIYSESENQKENEMVKSNCFLTIYTTLSDIKMNDDNSDEGKLLKDNGNKLNREIEKTKSISLFENSFMKDFLKDPKEMIKEAKDWVNQFINFYIYVLNWVKYENLFKKHPDINDRILARIMAFAYSILDNIANPDLNPAFQNFYLKENHQTKDESDESKNKSFPFMNEDIPSSSSLQSNMMEISSLNSDNEVNNRNHHSNNYANNIPVLPSNKTSIINFYSPKLKNKILLITKLIRILSRYETSSQIIGKNRGITILLQIMKLFSDCIEIQIECSASMANLASITSNRVKMLEEGCISLILENMNKFIASSDVQAEICATLANLACHDANAKYIVENGGCDYILRAMITHMDKTDLQIQAFHSLSSLCKYGKEEMEKDRFMQVIKTSIIKHQNSVDLMVSACNALGLMALSGMKMTSCKGTILVIILKSLKRYENHQIFQITAFFSLSHLLCIHDSNKDSVNSEIITKYKGVELILNAMKRFPYHISLQTTACFALESIIINHDNHRKEFLELNGIDIILNVMRFDFSLLKKRRSYFEDNKNEIVDTIDENENIDVSITLDLESSSESLFYSKYKDNSFHSFSKELLLQLFGSVALLNASDNKQCKEMIIKKGCLHYIYLASKKVANCNDLWLVLYYVFTRFSNNNESM